MTQTAPGERLQRDNRLLAMALKAITPDGNTQTPEEYEASEHAINDAIKRALHETDAAWRNPKGVPCSDSDGCPHDDWCEGIGCRDMRHTASRAATKIQAAKPLYIEGDVKVVREYISGGSIWGKPHAEESFNRIAATLEHWGGGKLDG